MHYFCDLMAILIEMITDLKIARIQVPGGEHTYVVVTLALHGISLLK